MDRIAAAALVATLLWAGEAAAGPLEGVWRSDREATLAGLQARGGFSERQWTLLSGSDFFGHMVHVYRGDAAFTIFEGECSTWIPVEVDALDGGRVLLRYLDGLVEPPTPREIEIRVAADHYVVPIQLLKDASEVFARVPAEEVATRHPCFAERMGELTAPAAHGEAP